MSKKPKKPPIDKKAVVARLEHARTEQLLVHVRRWIPDADRVDGFVVGIGAEWVALQQLSDRIVFDGWALLRRKDIQAVTIKPNPECFEIRALKARELWPPSAPALDLDDVLGAVSSAAKAAKTLVSISDDFYNPELCWIGTVGSIDRDRLQVTEVNPRGRWVRKPHTFDPADVTRIDFGGGYEEALHLAAGPPPA
jgi:hypothetical protein